MTPPLSPVPDEVADELQRVVHRWQQLPLDHALSRLALVRSLVEDLAGEPVPDLGPAVVMDQLVVMAYDRCAAGDAAQVLAELTALRRAL